MEHTALLIVDVQEGLVRQGPYRWEEMCAGLRRLLACARRAGLPVAYVQHDGGPGDALEHGGTGWQIAAAIAPREGEPVFEKRRNSAFYETGLDGYLKKEGVKTLILAGMQSEFCIDATCKAAFERGYSVLVPEGCTTTLEGGRFAAAETAAYFERDIWNGRYARVLPLAEVLEQIGGAGLERAQVPAACLEDYNKMLSGELYDCNNPALVEFQLSCLEKLYDYNATRPSEVEKRAAMLKEMFAEVGENCFVLAPFQANWGGRHVHFGKGVYANYNLTLVDDADIYVGDCTMIGPNVTIVTAGHPIQPGLREKVYEFNIPVRIGRNVWVGAGAVLLPGVSVGDNSVIGAGSVVTKDIPANVVAAGVPCRVLRPIGERDDEYYYKDRRIEL